MNADRMETKSALRKPGKAPAPIWLGFHASIKALTWAAALAASGEEDEALKAVVSHLVEEFHADL